MNHVRSDETLRLAVIEAILSAFDGVRRENGITLHEARVIDDGGSGEERAQARKKDTETRWQDIPDKWIEEFSDTLSFLCSKGFRYYIPAFMIWAMRHYDTSDSFAVDAAVYAFGVGPSDRTKLALFETFTQEQVKAVANFLEYFAEHADKNHADQDVAQEAMRKYWGRFL